MATIDVVGQGPNPDLLWGSSLCGWLRAGSSAVAQCSHALDVGSPGLRQLANAAEQGQRASSSSPLCLCLISHRGGDRVWALAALLSVPPGTVQYTNNHRAVCFTLLCTQAYVTHPHWWIFSGGSAPSSASRDDPLDNQPGSPVEFRVRPLTTDSRVLFATGRYGWSNNPSRA